ncbi:MAG: hypothetical protein ACO1G6_03575 [Bacteroidota bacterium]
MKHLFLFLFFISFIAQSANAQITTGEVYNFEVGDVFQVMDWDNGPGYALRLDTIAEKIIGVDTLKYVIHRIDGAFGPPPLPSFQYTTDTLVVANLNSPASHFSYWSCLTPIDDTTYNDCADTVFQRTSNFDETCFEPPMWTSYLRAGLGGPYFSLTDYSAYSYTHELIYSNTAMWGECGTYQDMFIGLKEETVSTEKELIRIIDLTGRETEMVSNRILIFIYSDGSREKMFVHE